VAVAYTAVLPKFGKFTQLVPLSVLLVELLHWGLVHNVTVGAHESPLTWHWQDPVQPRVSTPPSKNVWGSV
jgi:hypothetical protein